MAVFKDLETESGEIIAAFRKDAEALRESIAHPQGGAATINRHEAARRCIDAANRLKENVASMIIEVNEVPAADRAACRDRLQGYRKTAQQFEKDAQALQIEAANADRTELLGATRKNEKPDTNVQNENSTTIKMKTDLAANTRKTKESNEKLKEAERLTYEMNETADDTIDELGRQRSVIRRIADTTRATDEELSLVQRILRKMQKELLKHKLVMAAIIAILFVMIVALLYYKFGTSSSGGDSATVSGHVGVGGYQTASPSDYATASPYSGENVLPTFPSETVENSLQPPPATTGSSSIAETTTAKPI